MNRIPTAKEFAKDVWKRDIPLSQGFLEFAKLHVEAALEEAAKKAELGTGPKATPYKFVDRDSILNAYPLNNIT